MVHTQSERQVGETHLKPDTAHRFILSALFTSLFLILFLAALPVLGASLVLSLSSGSPGTSVDFSGSTFTGNATFRVHFAASTIFETIVSSGTVAVNERYAVWIFYGS